MARKTITINELAEIAWNIFKFNLNRYVQMEGKLSASPKTVRLWRDKRNLSKNALLFKEMEYFLKANPYLKEDDNGFEKFLSFIESLDYNELKQHCTNRKISKEELEKVSMDFAKMIYDFYQNQLGKSYKTKVSDLRDKFPEVDYKTLLDIVNERGDFENIRNHILENPNFKKEYLEGKRRDILNVISQDPIQPVQDVKEQEQSSIEIPEEDLQSETSGSASVLFKSVSIELEMDFEETDTLDINLSLEDNKMLQKAQEIIITIKNKKGEYNEKEN